MDAPLADASRKWIIDAPLASAYRKWIMDVPYISNICTAYILFHIFLDCVKYI